MGSNMLNGMAVAALYEYRVNICHELRVRRESNDSNPIIITFPMMMNRPWNNGISESHIVAFTIWFTEDAGGRCYNGALSLVNNIMLSAKHRDRDQVFHKLFAQFHDGLYQPFPRDFVVQE